MKWCQAVEAAGEMFGFSHTYAALLEICQMKPDYLREIMCGKGYDDLRQHNAGHLVAAGVRHRHQFIMGRWQCP